MAIQGADLISPKGEVERSLFPAEDLAALTARLDEYLQDGYARLQAAVPDMEAAEQDRAATDWAYHRAYHAVFVRLSSEPASASLSDQGSRTYSTAQVGAFKALAQAKLASWAARLEATGGGSGLPPSAFVPIQSTF